MKNPLPRPSITTQTDGTYCVTTHTPVLRKSARIDYYRTNCYDKALAKLDDSNCRWLTIPLHGFINQQEQALLFLQKNNDFLHRRKTIGRLNSIFTTMAKMYAMAPMWLAVELKNKVLPLWPDAMPGHNSKYYAAGQYYTALLNEFIEKHLHRAPPPNPFNQTYDNAY